ncbi:hypothetical protein EDB85DRAFT_1899166 [Lactarius pseudohatsudake]|nr:hypothetical protein EDB85DRAFT_1899166 [Lactarius pseudohatsudake]
MGVSQQAADGWVLRAASGCGGWQWWDLVWRFGRRGSGSGIENLRAELGQCGGGVLRAELEWRDGGLAVVGLVLRDVLGLRGLARGVGVERQCWGGAVVWGLASHVGTACWGRDERRWLACTWACNGSDLFSRFPPAPTSTLIQQLQTHPLSSPSLILTHDHEDRDGALGRSPLVSFPHPPHHHNTARTIADPPPRHLNMPQCRSQDPAMPPQHRAPGRNRPMAPKTPACCPDTTRKAPPTRHAAATHHHHQLTPPPSTHRHATANSPPRHARPRYRLPSHHPPTLPRHPNTARKTPQPPHATTTRHASHPDTARKTRCHPNTTQDPATMDPTWHALIRL